MKESGQHIWKHQKELRTGYTTGSCAAAAAKAAAQRLLKGSDVRQVELMTPNGSRLYLDVERLECGFDYVSCAVQKDSGDDPDVTNGVYVYARVERSEGTDVILKGGLGIGVVTRKGLTQEIGEPAINQVPRRMIIDAVDEIRRSSRYKGGLTVTISIPEGVALAEKTFNPRLGIQGGISVLGTTGIVEPMSEQALTETIYLEMKMLKENGHDWCYVVPGNYASDFLGDTLKYNSALAVKCSNYIGSVIDDAIRLKMKGILFVGHIGKLVKLAAGVMNTHSHMADGRMEILSAHAALAGAGQELIRNLMEAVTTAEALELLTGHDLIKPVMKTVLDRIEYHLKQRAGRELAIGAIVFSLEQGILGETADAARLISKIQKERV